MTFDRLKWREQVMGKNAPEYRRDSDLPSRKKPRPVVTEASAFEGLVEHLNETEDGRATLKELVNELEDKRRDPLYDRLPPEVEIKFTTN